MDVDAISDLLAEVAERVILPRFGALASGEILEKSPGDLVTVADREAEADLARALKAAHPGSLVVGEEGTFTDPRGLAQLAGADHAWVIDPVDGTRNFAHGKPDFAVMLAEVCHGETAHGWILQPVHHRLYVAEHGAGVTRNGVAIRRTWSDRPVPVGGTYIRPVPEAAGRVQVVRPSGSCGIDYPRLVEGALDFLAYRSMHPWDHLPGGLMVREIGGRVATEAGVEFGAGVTGHRLVAAADEDTWELARDALFGSR